MTKEISIYLERLGGKPFERRIPRGLSVKELREKQPELEHYLILVKQGKKVIIE